MLVSGCATQPREPRDTVSFEVLGKIGVRDAGNGYSAQFSWRQYPEGYDIEVWGPLGQGRTRLQSDGPLMEVWQGEQMLARGTPEQVMLASLGWSMPVEVLPFWMQGRPHRDFPVADVQRDAEDRFVAFMQAGWQVELSRYDGGADVHPGRVVALQGERKVTVIVRGFSE